MNKIVSALAIAGIAIMGSCNTAAIKEKDAALVAQQNTIDSMKMEIAKQRVVDSMNEMAQMRYVIPQVVAPAAAVAAVSDNAPVVKSSAKKSTARKSTARRSRSVARSSASGRSNGSYAGNSASESSGVYQDAPVVTPQKKGWSAKAKGAVIGAGAGAIGGAIINKRNRVAGAVIGGVLGAGAGTGIGAIIDKKNGR